MTTTTQPTEDGWIRLADEQPPDTTGQLPANADYLIALRHRVTEKQRVTLARWLPADGMFQGYSENKKGKNWQVTHWQPKPSLPITTAFDEFKLDMGAN